MGKNCILRIFVTLIIIAMSISGCVLQHPTDPYAQASSLTNIPFNDPLVVPQSKGQITSIRDSLSLERSLEIALANNPEIAATAWDVAGASAKLDSASAQRWPTLSAEGGYQHFNDDQRLIAARYNGEPGYFDQDLYRGDLVVKLPLYTGGRITSDINSAQLLKLAEEKRLSRTREELVFNVSSTFYAILGQLQVIHSLDFSIGAMDAHRKQVSDRLVVQKAARVDLLRTEVRLADLRQSLIREENVLATQKRLLASLLGITDDVEHLDLSGELALEAVPVPGMEESMHAAFNNRNDYLAAKARLESQARRVDAAMAGHSPTLSLLGSYGIRADAAGDSEDVAVVGANVSLPLFEGGRTVASVNQERAVLAAMQERLRKQELQIRQEVELALLDIRSSRERLNALQLAVDQAAESLRIERMKDDLGKGSITDVLDAQSALLQSETSYARALADLQIAMARLTLASGENRS